MGMLERARALEDRVESSAREHMLFGTGGPVVVMVSGGSDSVALLYLCVRLHARFGAGRLCVLHVNHMLRGAQADGDARFVSALALQLDVPCVVRSVDVASIAAEEGANIEDTGRRERYRLANGLLDELCRQQGCDTRDGRIAVAHTADDRTETFFMRAIEGTGPAGLASIPRVRGRIIRPLLDETRADLRSYLEETTTPLRAGGLPAAHWREDATNEDTAYFRAYVRHEILPAARSWNPHLEQAVARVCDVLADENRCLDGQAQQECVRLSRRLPDGRVSLDAVGLAACAPALQRRVLREVLSRELADGTRLEYSHVEAVRGLLCDPGASTTVVGGLQVRNDHGSIVVGSADEEFAGFAGGWLALGGELGCGTAGVMSAMAVEQVGARVARGEIALGDDPQHRAYVGVAGMDRFWVRPTRDGDRMRPLGMESGTKKTGDILTDAKIPRWRRDMQLVVCAGDGPDAEIIWLVGVCVSERFKVSPHTGRGVLLAIDESRCGHGNG